MTTRNWYPDPQNLRDWEITELEKEGRADVLAAALRHRNGEDDRLEKAKEVIREALAEAEDNKLIVGELLAKAEELEEELNRHIDSLNKKLLALG